MYLLVVAVVEDVNLSIVLLSVGVVKISPCENSRTFVNGKLVTECTVLRSGECCNEDTLDCVMNYKLSGGMAGTSFNVRFFRGTYYTWKQSRIQI